MTSRAIEILPPQPEGQGASMPEAYYSYSCFSFLGSPRGELYLSLGRRIVLFDLTFDAAYNEEFAEMENFGSIRLTRALGEREAMHYRQGCALTFQSLPEHLSLP